VADDEWVIYLVDEVRDWIRQLDAASRARVVQALDLLAEAGPGLGRPLVDSIRGLDHRQPQRAAPRLHPHLVRLRP
jgi:hypothetical protein